jgi:hypothetical protein
MSAGGSGRRTRRERVATWLDRLASIAFAALIVAMPWRLRADPFAHPTSLAGPLSDVVVYAIDGLIGLTLGLWLLARLVDRRAIRLGPRALLVPIAVLVALAWLTLPFGVAPSLSVFGAIRVTALAALYLYVVNRVPGLASLAVPIGAMIGIEAVVAIGQFATQGSLGLMRLGELRLDPAVYWSSIVLREDGVRILRAYGLSTHPNVLGGFFAAGIPLLLGYRPTAAPGRILQALTIGLAVGGLLVTFSRGAWLGLAAGLLVTTVILGVRAMRADGRQWLAVGALALVVVVVGGWQVRQELVVRTGLTAVPAPTELRSVDERLAQIELGWQVLLERPLLGTGLSAVPVEMQRLDPAFPYSFYPPHLVPLTVAAELGIGGGLAILALLAAPWVLLLRARNRWNRELAAASGALAVVTVTGLFDDYPWVGGPGRTLLWVLLGLWAVAWLRAGARDEPEDVA